MWAMYTLGMLVALAFAFVLRRTSYPPRAAASCWNSPVPLPHRAGAVEARMAPHRQLRAARPHHGAGHGGGRVAAARHSRRGGASFATVAPQDSLFGRVSQAMSPIFAPLGFGTWQATGALVPGFIAKEVVVGTLGQIYLGEEAARPTALGLVDGVVQAGRATWDAVVASVSAIPTILALPSLNADATGDLNTPLAAALARAFTPASGLSYLVFVLLYTPCIATVGALAQEHGRRFAWTTVTYQLATAWIAAFLVYQLARAVL